MEIGGLATGKKIDFRNSPIIMELPSPTLLSFLWSKDALLSVLLILVASLLYSLWGAFDSIWWSQRRIRRMFQSQGIPCLPGRFLYGDLPELVELGKEAQKSAMPEITHDITSRIQSHLHVWNKRYGKPFIPAPPFSISACISFLFTPYCYHKPSLHGMIILFR